MYLTNLFFKSTLDTFKVYIILLILPFGMLSCSKQDDISKVTTKTNIKSIPKQKPNPKSEYVPLNSGTMYIMPLKATRKHQDSKSISYYALMNCTINKEDFGSFTLHKGEGKTKEYFYYNNETIDSSTNYAHYVSGFINVDLDNDGDKDAIGSISVSTGGSGCFTSMDIFLNEKRKAKYTAYYFIYDREYVDSVKVSGNLFEAFFTVHGDGDSAGEPTHHMRKKFLFENKKLIKLEELRY